MAAGWCCVLRETLSVYSDCEVRVVTLFIIYCELAVSVMSVLRKRSCGSGMSRGQEGAGRLVLPRALLRSAVCHVR